MVPSIRVQELNQKPCNSDGKFVLYWMTANRRTQYNFALDRAIEWANELGKPLLIVENLRSDYRWACDRFHQFVIDGMIDNQMACRSSKVNYLPFVESHKNELPGFLEKVAKQSAAVVTDDNPAFFFPAVQKLLSRRIQVAFQSVDSVGLLPMRAADKIFKRAHDFRTFNQKSLKNHLVDFPQRDPCKLLKNKKKIDFGFLQKKWQPTKLDSVSSLIDSLDIDHTIQPNSKGGCSEASAKLEQFLAAKLHAYSENRNYPQLSATSDLSGYLHFGHISSHQIFEAIAHVEGWTPNKIASQPTKKALGWWGMSPDAENYLDQLVVWRELGFNMASKDRGYRKYSSLPDWAQTTLDEHRHDARTPCYSEEELDQSQTDDAIWNAAQTQLRTEGTIHNYLRMLWGKKMLQWTESPEEALRIMIHLNNKYAIDGRDPNSYSGIFWILGRYDRAWGPERKIFGKIRYMTSENTARKYPVKEYVEKYSGELLF